MTDAELRGDLSESVNALKDSASRKVRDVKDRASATWSDIQSTSGKSAERPV